MIIQVLNLILLLVCVLPSMIADTYTNCDRSCGGGGPPMDLPTPFGFSPGCQIPLNCTRNGTMLIHDFPVQKITSDTIVVNIPAKCSRPIETLRALFRKNYAPTIHNAILLQNCTSKPTGCSLPSTMVLTHFELLGCSPNNNSISCYHENSNKSLFMNLDGLMKTRCWSFFSAISAESFGNTSAVSLEVQVVELGWWLEGHSQCSGDAKCTYVVSPINGRPGYRCECLEGFVGDGYKHGQGCRKAFPVCNPSNYISGQCGGTRLGALIGGVAAGASLMVSMGLICCCIRRRSKSRARSRTRRQLCEATGINIPFYPYKEIEKATDFFSDKQQLGKGAYGTVYSGRLHNDDLVAIKRIKHRDTDSIEQVLNEIKLLSSVNHPNLVRLLGCSIDKGEQILVYEFMPNGTLSQHLQKERGNGLSWPVRLTIATETAQAIAYLHNAMNPPIYHRDIKSSNILLDHNYKSKVADFGLSRLGMVEISHISTAPQGTPGYVDPQYHQNFHLSDKSDVYSFGVVLAEVITGLKAVDFSRPQNEVNLAALAMDRIGKGCLEEIVDPFLDPTRDAWTVSSLHKVAELAFRCLAFHRDMRPSMMEVAIELEQIRLSIWENSEDKEAISSGTSSCSSSSNVSEKPLSLKIKKPALDSRGLFGSAKSMERVKDYSPVSVQAHWPSEQSSPSTSTLLSNVVQ